MQVLDDNLMFMVHGSWFMILWLVRVMINSTEVNVLGVRFDAVKMSDVLLEVDRAVESNSKIKLAFSNPEFVVVAQKSSFLKGYLNSTKFNVADGVGILMAACLLGKRLPERITGTDFVYELASLSSRKGHRVFLLGGRPGVAELASQRLLEKYEGCRIVGCRDGFFSDDDDVVEQINESNCDVLMVCLGNPAQEEWIQKNYSQINANVIFGNGGALDFAAGLVTRAPYLFQRLGLEWLWRLKNDFTLRRFKRMLRLPYFSILIFREFLLRR